MEFHALSRRELQALCKRNAIRANMSNAAMVEALRSLSSSSVEGVGEIGRAVPHSPPSSEVAVLEEQAHGLPIPRSGRARAKTRTAAREGAAPVEAEEVTAEEQGHGCPLPRGGARAKTRKSGARKMEAAAQPVDVEEVATGKARTRRSTRSSNVKIDSVDKEGEVPAAAREEQKADSSDAAIGSAVASDKSFQDLKEHKVVAVVEEDVAKSEEGRNVTRMAAGTKRVAMAKKRTRGSTRSNKAVAAPKGLNADSSDMTVGPAIVSDKPVVLSDKDEVVAMLEEATKPQEGENVTRMATVCKAPEVQQGKTIVEPEAGAHVEEDVVATAKRRTRRRRRSTRSKVAVVEQKGQKADSSDATIRSAVLVNDQSCDYPEEEQVVAVVEEGAKKASEGTTKEQDQISTVHNPASLVEVEDSPIVSVPCNEHAANVSYKAPFAGEEVVKDDCFTLTGEDDQSNLLVNPLDRLAKPMYEFTVKAEKKSSECWWMLM